MTTVPRSACDGVWLRAAAAGLLLGLLGCAREPTTSDYDRFIPTEEAAQAALEAALTAWQSGRLPGFIASVPVPVVAVDAEWARGERLQSFSVLGQSPGNGPRSLVVRLKLASQRADANARFVVFGKDPLWVFRHEELDMMAHMEHPASDPALPAPKSPAANANADLPINP